MPKRKRNEKRSGKGTGGSGGRGPKEIVFDPEARRDYLKGFSERKRERRAFGLAMQKVKDRNEKLEARRDRTKARLEQVEEAERQKEEFRNAILQQQKLDKAAAKAEESASDSDDDDQSPRDGGESSQSDRKNKSEVTEDHDQKEAQPATVTTAYRDGITQDHWGGHVIVTTSTEIPDDDDDDDNDFGASLTQHNPNQDDSKIRKKAAPSRKNGKKKSVDSRQEYAGKVDKFLGQLKGNMPAKKQKTTLKNNKQPTMKGSRAGSTSAGDVKIAQKALARSKAKRQGKQRSGSRRH
mmetsp:Transcript_10766/g.22111  ORF Transcript_10766/g.22111 Transcript_10766/m.22111 type:complete len:295 (+) Transcript_10766:71-955(+)